MQMSTYTRLQFSTNKIKVPMNWQEPQGDTAKEHYGKAFKDADKNTSPDPTQPALFTAHTMNKIHTDAQKMMTSGFGGFFDDITKAICSAWSQTQMKASFGDGIVNGPTVMGGKVTWDDLYDPIMQTAPKKTQQLEKYSKVVAKVVAGAWSQFVKTIVIATPMPVYPMFLLWPALKAPPTPAVAPIPVAAMVKVPPMAMKLTDEMVQKLGERDAVYHRELFDAISTAFCQCVVEWSTTTTIVGLLGEGNVPTYAPPTVPMGPIVMGSAKNGKFV
jgi:hypothetical protein